MIEKIKYLRLRIHHLEEELCDAHKWYRLTERDEILAATTYMNDQLVDIEVAMLEAIESLDFDPSDPEFDDYDLYDLYHNDDIMWLVHGATVLIEERDEIDELWPRTIVAYIKAITLTKFIIYDFLMRYKLLDL